VIDGDLLVQMAGRESARAESRQHDAGTLHRSQAVRLRLDADVSGTPRPKDPLRQPPLQIHGILVDVLQHHGGVREGLVRVHEPEGDPRHVGGTPADDDDTRAHGAQPSSLT